MFRLLTRTFRHTFRPLSRPAAIFLAWTHRYTVALWGRSLIDEGRYQASMRAVAPTRWRKLLTALWRVTSDPRLANAPELHRLTVVGDRVAPEVPDTWHARHLLDVRLGADLTDVDAETGSTNRRWPTSESVAAPPSFVA
jgi:hypothetical protein